MKTIFINRHTQILLFILGIILVFIAVTLPVTTEAQEYNLISPISNDPSFTRGGGLLGQYAQTVYQTALGAAAILAVMMLVIGGVRYTLTAVSPDEKSTAKGYMWNALWGLFIVLAAWLVLYTINPDLVFLDFRIPRISISPAAPPTPPPPPIGLPPLPGTPVPAIEGVVRQRFSADNITINRIPCSPWDPNDPLTPRSGCTNVGGLRESAISGTIQIKSECGCTVKITGGSERNGHNCSSSSGTHCSGDKVDLFPNGALQNYLNSHRVGGGGGSTFQIQLDNGTRATVINEGDHFDIEFN